MESGYGSRGGGGKAHVVAVDPVQRNKLKRRRGRGTMRSSWSRVWAWKRGEDNHVGFVGGREEDATVAAALVILLQMKIARRGDAVGGRSWRKRTRWHCFLVLGGLRRSPKKQDEDNDSKEKKQESKSSNNCSHYSLYRGGGREWGQSG